MMETFASAEGKALLFSRRRLFSFCVAAQHAQDAGNRAVRTRSSSRRPPPSVVELLGSCSSEAFYKRARGHSPSPGARAARELRPRVSEAPWGSSGGTAAPRAWASRCWTRARTRTISCPRRPRSFRRTRMRRSRCVTRHARAAFRAGRASRTPPPTFPPWAMAGARRRSSVAPPVFLVARAGRRGSVSV